MQRLLLALPLLLAAGCCRAADSADTAVDALWQAMSRPAGQPGDLARLDQVLHPRAMVAGAAAGTARPLDFSGKAAFMAAISRVRTTGFYECELHRQTQVTGDFAMVFSVVESRTRPDLASDSHVGVNNIQLHRTDGRWQILALHYYLTTPAAIAASLPQQLKRSCRNPLPVP